MSNAFHHAKHQEKSLSLLLLLLPLPPPPLFFWCSLMIAFCVNIIIYEYIYTHSVLLLGLVDDMRWKRARWAPLWSEEMRKDVKQSGHTLTHVLLVCHKNIITQWCDWNEWGGFEYEDYERDSLFVRQADDTHTQIENNVASPNLNKDPNESGGQQRGHLLIARQTSGHYGWLAGWLAVKWVQLSQFNLSHTRPTCTCVGALPLPHWSHSIRLHRQLFRLSFIQ